MVTKGQILNYIQVRNYGEFNMITDVDKVLELTGIESREDYFNFIDNYKDEVLDKFRDESNWMLVNSSEFNLILPTHISQSQFEDYIREVSISNLNLVSKLEEIILEIFEYNPLPNLTSNEELKEFIIWLGNSYNSGSLNLYAVLIELNVLEVIENK